MTETLTQPANNPNTPFVSASLYVGDLHPDVFERELFDLFSQVGNVMTIRVLRDSVTRRSLGYAYVNFQNAADAERAWDSLNFTSLRGIPIRIMWKQRDPTLRKSGVGNIFIKNLEKTVNSRALFDTFSRYGTILSCKVVTDANGNSRGYGFVQYESKEAAEKSIAEVNGKMIMGKVVYVGPFIKNRTPDDQNKFNNVFVKNFEASVTDEQFQKYFEKYGPISSAVIMKDSEGKSKCFGFVCYKEPTSAKNLVDTENGKTPFGTNVVFCGRAEKKSYREKELRERREKAKMAQILKYQGMNLYIKNLDDSIDDAKLRAAFEQFGAITSVKVMLDENRKSKGFGFVCYSVPDEATRALTEMNGKMLGEKPIFVALHQPKELRHQQAPFSQFYRFPAAPVMYPPPMPARQPFMMGYPQSMPPAGRFPFARPPMGMQQFPARRAAGPRPPRGPAAGGDVPPAAIAPGSMPVGAMQQNRPRAPGAINRAPMPGRAQNRRIAPEKIKDLAVENPDTARRHIGEIIYSYVIEYPSGGQDISNLAGKITGMLLEGLDMSELLHLLESREAANAKIGEALRTLMEAGRA